ncbi:MAG: DUF2232 domain-containing protein [Actinomycetota bacterium]|nr:DUF2232 domain-containing protein [Actinomycetota bacterium]
MRHRGPLAPEELAEAAVFAAAGFLLVLLSRLVPLIGIVQVLATVAWGILAARRRTRVVVLGVIAAALVATLAGGVRAAGEVVVAGMYGWPVGRGIAAGWSRWRIVGWTLAVGWSSVAAISVAFFAVFAEARQLLIDQYLAEWRGLRRVLEWVADQPGADAVVESLGGLEAIVAPGDRLAELVPGYWWLFVPAGQLVVSVIYALCTTHICRPVLDRLEHALGEPEPMAPTDDGPAGPVPVDLGHVSLRRGDRTVLRDVDLEVRPGELVVLTGANGAGKSSLLAVLAGMTVPDGSVRRPGAIALGRPGGTAWIGQRPDSQVLGATVADDLRWGCGDVTAIAGALDRVGLAGAERRDTTSLSGGELQRLAIASAVVRRPALLLSDESTSMLDPDGRDALRALLRRIADEGTAVVHVSHLADDRAIADRVVTIDGGRVVAVRDGRAA